MNGKMVELTDLVLAYSLFFEKDLQWMNRAQCDLRRSKAFCLQKSGGFENITIDLILRYLFYQTREWICEH